MQKEYKNAMEQISLSDSDKARILANVKKACENTDTDVDENRVVRFRMRPNFSIRRMGTVAACLVLLAGGIFAYHKMTGSSPSASPNPQENPEICADNDEITWEELDSIEEISEKTDCETYTLSNVSASYRVKKVEVAREQRHVRITYKNKKNHDRILFEYKEEQAADELLNQFEGEDTLSTEKVGGSDVTMYGKEECDAMTWENEKCTFAVRMSKSRTKKAARKLVSGTVEGVKNIRPVDKNKITGTGKLEKKDTKTNEIGWYGDEQPLDEESAKQFFRKIEELFGFYVEITSPAEKVCYKRVGDYESFAFYYPNDEKLDGKRIIGYVGAENCPKGVLAGYKSIASSVSGGIMAEIYQNAKEEKALQFQKEDAVFTFLLEGYTGESLEDVLNKLLSVIQIIAADENAPVDETPAVQSTENNEVENTATDDGKQEPAGEQDAADENVPEPEDTTTVMPSEE